MEAGFDHFDATRLVDLGASLGTQDASERTIGDIERYRRERDAHAKHNVAATVNPR